MQTLWSGKKETFNTVKQLFDQIETWMDANQDGWSTKPKVAALVGAVLATRPKVIVQIGIWSGKSLIPVAMTLKHLHHNGCVIGIDPWSPDASTSGMEGDHKKWWETAPHDRIHQQFVEEMIKTGVAPWCKIFRCRSDEWKIPSDLDIGLLEIDGNHGEFASTYDVTHYAPHVAFGGFLWMDDTSWAAKATAMLPLLGFKALFSEDGGTMFQRIAKV